MNSNTDNKLSQLNWKDTQNFNGNTYSMVYTLNEICGESVYGKGNCYAKNARKNLNNLLEKSANMDVFKCVEKGIIIISPPTTYEMIDRLVELGKRSIKYYSQLSYKQTNVTDNWCKDAYVKSGQPLNNSKPLHHRILNKTTKRFSGKTISVNEAVIDTIKTSGGMLAEGHIIAFLNSRLKCPECDIIGKFGLCEGITNRSVDGFRDAVCMNCLENNITTLFEIKTRWEDSVVKEGNGTYAGSFAALNTLMTIRANIYLVITSRDTGDVRIGKITSAKIRGNKNWLYALQEGFKWGGPSSYVTCKKGLFKCPEKMKPIIETLDPQHTDYIINTALTKIGL